MPILQGKKILVTGGAGFIGSNIADYLLENGAKLVRVMDNLSTGHLHNIQKFFSDNRFEFHERDIRDLDACKAMSKGMDYIIHQAALGSVPRSIKDPILTNENNVSGFLNILVAARDEQVKRVVYAASSSTYGDSEGLPKVENRIGKPLSPYAVTKYVNELYADVFARTYEMEIVGLRYFNVFGPKQDPNGAYAAVIPKFIQQFIDGISPTINGDGTISRDFTYVDNAVQANVKALFSPIGNGINQIYNIACGQSTSLNELASIIKKIIGSDIEVIHGSNRKGDIEHSLADIGKAEKYLGYKPDIQIVEGIEKTIRWFEQQNEA